LKARGSWRAEGRLAEPTDEVVVPTCPDWLDKEGRAEWRRLAPLLKRRRTVSKAARGVLAVLCQNWSLLVRAGRKLNELLEDPESDQKAVRRWAVLSNEATKNYLRAAAEFGLSPAAKARVRPAEAPEKEDDDAERFFRSIG